MKKTYNYKGREFFGLIEFLTKEVFTVENFVRGVGVFLMHFGYYAPKTLIPIPYIEKSYQENIIFMILGTAICLFGPYLKTIIEAKLGLPK